VCDVSPYFTFQARIEITTGAAGEICVDPANRAIAADEEIMAENIAMQKIVKRLGFRLSTIFTLGGRLPMVS
jgi:hypothetical protein